MAVLTSGAGVVNVTHGTYWIVHSATGPTLEGEPAASNGLTAFWGDLLLVHTGTFFGPLHVTVEIHDSVPRLDLEGWSDVVEVSQPAPAGLVCLVQPMEGAPPDLPGLELAHDGACRVRIHSRGRDEAAKYLAIVPEVVEEHLVQLWASPVSAEVRHRLTDEVGRLRRND